jgi:hypothetical protein
MPDALSEIEGAISAHKLLSKKISKGTTRLVRSREELTLVKATAFAWFKNRRPPIALVLGENAFSSTDDYFKECLNLAEKSASRQTYKSLLNDLGKALLILQQEILTKPRAESSLPSENPPDFSPLISDSKMQEILIRRWIETQRCIRADAPLSAVVMMGGLLEAIILSRLNTMPDKAPAFKAKTAPKDAASKTLPLREWGLRNYLDVAHELGWIGQSAKDVGVVLRDYRNYIHPAKEYSHGTTVTQADSLVMWMVFVSITDQLITSVK